MKTIHFFAALVIVLGLMSGCSKEEVENTTEAVKESAAEMQDAAEDTLEKAGGTRDRSYR